MNIKVTPPRETDLHYFWAKRDFAFIQPGVEVFVVRKGLTDYMQPSYHGVYKETVLEGSDTMIMFKSGGGASPILIFPTLKEAAEAVSKNIERLSEENAWESRNALRRTVALLDGQPRPDLAEWVDMDAESDVNRVNGIVAFLGKGGTFTMKVMPNGTLKTEIALERHRDGDGLFALSHKDHSLEQAVRYALGKLGSMA